MPMPETPAQWLFLILLGCLGFVQALVWRLVSSFEDRITKLESYSRQDISDIHTKLTSIESRINSIQLNIEQRFMTKDECMRHHRINAISDQHKADG